MKTTIITFVSLGNKSTVAAADIVPVIRAFDRKGALDKVICYTNRNFYFKKTYSAIPLVLYYCLRLMSKIGLQVSRFAEEKLFDFISQFRVVSDCVIIFHGGFFLPRTFRRAKVRSITIDIPRLVHFERNIVLEKEEAVILGVSSINLYYQTLMRKYSHLKEFDYIIAISEMVRESYVKAGFPEKNIFLAVPDIDTDRFTLDVKRQEEIYRVLYIAYTTPLKGLHYLLEAWGTLSIPDSELVIVGGYGTMDKKVQEKLESMINRLPNIRFVGHTDAPETYYKESSIFVFPSITESFGRVTLEAMSCGLPVITTENARGIVEDNKTGFVVPIRDSHAIKEKIEYLYNNPDVRERMGREARKAVENKKPFGEAVYEIYQEILKREGKL